MVFNHFPVIAPLLPSDICSLSPAVIHVSRKEVVEYLLRGNCCRGGTRREGGFPMMKRCHCRGTVMRGEYFRENEYLKVYFWSSKTHRCGLFFCPYHTLQKSSLRCWFLARSFSCSCSGVSLEVEAVSNIVDGAMHEPDASNLSTNISESLKHTSQKRTISDTK